MWHQTTAEVAPPHIMSWMSCPKVPGVAELVFVRYVCVIFVLAHLDVDAKEKRTNNDKISTLSF